MELYSVAKKTALADTLITSVINGCQPSETGESCDQGFVRDTVLS